MVQGNKHSNDLLGIVDHGNGFAKNRFLWPYIRSPERVALTHVNCGVDTFFFDAAAAWLKCPNELSLRILVVALVIVFFDGSKFVLRIFLFVAAWLEGLHIMHNVGLSVTCWWKSIYNEDINKGVQIHRHARATSFKTVRVKVARPPECILGTPHSVASSPKGRASLLQGRYPPKRAL